MKAGEGLAVGVPVQLAGGALVLISRSPEDGSVVEAGPLRIFFS